LRFKINETDKVYFPFRDDEMEVRLAAEQFTMSRKLDCFDRQNFEEWDKTGQLFVWGHGSQKSEIKHLIRGTLGTGGRAAWQVADDVAEMKFPKGAGNEIVVWSCHSGVVGGFAQLLTLHLINHGYLGKKVWGATKYTGTIDADKSLRVCDSLEDDAAIYKATDADVSFYIGAGTPLASL
jgi:hypothetical protein